MSYLLIHNGNNSVSSWAASFFDCQPLPFFNDDWVFDQRIIKSFHEKVSYLNSGNFCTSITASEGLDIFHTYKDLKNIKIVKILTSLNDDRNNLDPAWNFKKYNQDQWITNSFFGLSIADQLIKWHDFAPIDIKNDQGHIIFTPGRSGTHILKSLLDVNFLHHDHLSKSLNFSKLMPYQYISSILRKCFHDYALSDTIGEIYGFVITTNDNLSDIQNTIESWQPIIFDESHARRCWEKMTTFLDILLGLKIVYNKKINFYLMEDLKPYYHQIPILKNPYDKKKLILNYDESLEICEKYQPQYDNLITKIINMIGLTVYHL